MTTTTTLKRNVTRTSAILLVVSAIVGSGVFKKIAPMAEVLHSPWLILVCWLVAGLLSLMGALCTAELAAMMPGSGGEFVYFKKIYGRFFSFLYGWANLVVMKTATIAALAYIFAQSFHALAPLPILDVYQGEDAQGFSIKLLATVLVIVLSYINYRGVSFSAGLSRLFITAIVLVMVVFVIYAFFFYSGTTVFAQPSHSGTSLEGFSFTTAFFAASLSAFWGYEGWNNVGYIGEEIKNPQKNIPIALFVGTLGVVCLYMLMNAAFLNVMDVDALAGLEQNKIAAVEVANVMSGQTGALVLSILILFSTFNCANSSILMSARIFYAMSKDKLFLAFAGKVHPKHHSPSNAIILQGAWATVLIWWGTFDELTDLLIFAAFIFYGATAVGVILMRIREPQAERPYKVFAYPVLPLLFALFCLALVLVTIINQPQQALVGLLLISTGIPVYLYYMRKEKLN